MKSNSPVIKNKKASFNYSFIETYIAGIVLNGGEIKSIREGKTSLVDSYCYFNNGELMLKNSYIALYKRAFYDKEYDTYRDRKLLMRKAELHKLNNEVKTPGYSIIPVKMFFEHGLCKIEIALCKGKKEYDKRETIKEKEAKRDIDRLLKRFK